MKIVVLTNDNHLFLLNGFQYLWNKYCGLPVTIYGFQSPHNLFPNFTFKSLGQQLPASQWSNALIQMIDDIEDEYFLLVLEDYWLFNKVDTTVLPRLANSLAAHDCLSINLNGNRASYKQHFKIGNLGDYDIIETPKDTPYQLSFQAAIWHKHNMLDVLRENENPWQSEIEGSKRVKTRVLGTNPAVMQYQQVWRSKQKRWQLDKLNREDLNYLYRRGWIVA